MDPIAGFVLGFCIDHSYLDMVVDDERVMLCYGGRVNSNIGL
jgi:hypothetical protein